MKVLELNRKYLILLGVYPASNAIYRAVFKTAYFIILLLQILGLLAGVWFIVTFITTDLNSVFYAGFHTSAYSTSTYSLLVGFIDQDEIVAIFQTLQHIYDKCNRLLPSIFPRIYWIHEIDTYSFLRSHRRFIENFVGCK